MFGKKTRKGILLGLIIGIAFILALGAGYVTSNYHEVGGARWVIGGSLDVVSGGDMDIESGGSFKIAGTAVTSSAAELNTADVTAAGTVEPNKVVVVDANKDIGQFRNVEMSGNLVLEGSTADGNEITVSHEDPDADYTVTIPAETGFVMLSNDTVYGIDDANSIWAVADGLTAEGATADGNETTITYTDPTADRTITVPDTSGTLLPYNAAILSAGDISATNCYGSTLYGSDVDANLPAAVAGMDVTIYLKASADVNVNPDDADQILALTNAAGDAISSDATAGSFIHLKTIDDVNWINVGSSGTWSDIN